MQNLSKPCKLNCATNHSAKYWFHKTGTLNFHYEVFCDNFNNSDIDVKRQQLKTKREDYKQNGEDAKTEK